MGRYPKQWEDSLGKIGTLQNGFTFFFKKYFNVSSSYFICCTSYLYTREGLLEYDSFKECHCMGPC